MTRVWGSKPYTAFSVFVLGGVCDLVVFVDRRLCVLLLVLLLVTCGLRQSRVSFEAAVRLLGISLRTRKFHPR
jgi:hypothetical protein